jgi:hypothetical protein
MDVPQEVPKRDVMVERLWPEKGSGTLLGPDKSGKTQYALEEALCLATGMDVLGRFKVPTRRRVLYITEEDTQERVLRRVYDLLRLHGSLDPASEVKGLAMTGAFLVLVGNHFRLDSEADVAKLEETLRKDRIDVLYLDALGKMTKQQISHDHDAGRLVELFTRLEASGPTVLRVVHHTSKLRRQGWTPDTATVRDASGHHAFADWCRSSLLFSRGNPVIVTPRPDEVVDVPSRIRFEGSDGAPVRLGVMVQQHLNTPEDSHLIGLGFTETEAANPSRLDPAVLKKVIGVLADPTTQRIKDANTGVTGVAAVEVADRAGFGRSRSAKLKAGRYLAAVVEAKKARLVTEGLKTVRGTALWEAA